MVSKQIYCLQIALQYQKMNCEIHSGKEKAGYRDFEGNLSNVN